MAQALTQGFQPFCIINPLETEQPESGRSRWLAMLGHHPPWRSRSVAVASLLMLVGAGFWLRDRPESAVELTESSICFRLGGSYLGGYLIGWLFQRGVKVMLFVCGLLISGLAMLKLLGWSALNGSPVEQNLSHSLAWFQAEAEGWRRYLTGYLPSATTAAVGVFLGARRK